MARFTQFLFFSCLLVLVCGHGINAARDVKLAAVADPKDLDGRFKISDFHKTANIGSSERTRLVDLVGKYSLRDHSHDNMEHSKGGLFTVDELHNNFQAGKMLPIFFPNKDPATSPFLPKKVADSIPFSSSKLPEILRLFSIAPGSPLAKSMEDTLSKCEYAPAKGETKTCATSLESTRPQPTRPCPLLRYRTTGCWKLRKRLNLRGK